MIKTFTCKQCGVEFNKETRSYAFYCPGCRKKKNVEKVMRSRKKRLPQTKVGVGSGGNQEGNKTLIGRADTAYIRRLTTNLQRARNAAYVEVKNSWLYTIRI